MTCGTWKFKNVEELAFADPVTTTAQIVAISF